MSTGMNTEVKILLAAVECIEEDGIKSLTTRKVAAKNGAKKHSSILCGLIVCLPFFFKK